VKAFPHVLHRVMSMNAKAPKYARQLLSKLCPSVYYMELWYATLAVLPGLLCALTQYYPTPVTGVYGPVVHHPIVTGGCYRGLWACGGPPSCYWCYRGLDEWWVMHDRTRSAETGWWWHQVCISQGSTLLDKSVYCKSERMICFYCKAFVAT
jgi:hypothetical protein